MPRPVNRRRYRRAVHTAKLKARSELGTSSPQWWHCNFAKTFDLSPDSFEDTCPRIDAREVAFEQFRSDFEQPNKPVVIQNDQQRWRANKKWTLDRLARKYRNQRFKCGEDDSGTSVKLKMKYFVQYMRENEDDSPLYIFDANFGEHPKRKRLLDDYVVSKYFPEDLFSFGDPKRRPPHRWFVMGPARSGTSIHIDPLGTSAWNALVHGYKRWCLFPPQTPKELIKFQPGEGGLNKGEAITWFVSIYPRTRLPDWPQTYKPIEFLQHPGETAFIPGGWWHVVLNLTDTVAVTQNFCSSVNFRLVWYKTARSRPRFAKNWLASLRQHRPDLAAVADNVDLCQRPDGLPISSSSSSSSSSSTSSSCECSSCCSECSRNSRSRKRSSELQTNSFSKRNRRLSPLSKSPSPKRMR